MKVKLGFFYDAWKVLADWIKGESSDKPKVDVTGTVQVSATDPLPVSINGNNMTLYGADIADRPPADSVVVGTTFTLVNADLDTWISNGTDWVVV